MAEVPIASFYASVMYVDESSGQWVPMSTGYTHLSIYHNQALKKYRIIGLNVNENTYGLNAAITAETSQYSKATDTFHQFIDLDKAYGFNFYSVEDANAFLMAFQNALNDLQKPAPLPQFPQPRNKVASEQPQEPNNDASAQTPISKPKKTLPSAAGPQPINPSTNLMSEMQMKLQKKRTESIGANTPVPQIEENKPVAPSTFVRPQLKPVESQKSTISNNNINELVDSESIYNRFKKDDESKAAASPGPTRPVSAKKTDSENTPATSSPVVNGPRTSKPAPAIPAPAVNTQEPPKVGRNKSIAPAPPKSTEPPTAEEESTNPPEIPKVGTTNGRSKPAPSIPQSSKPAEVTAPEVEIAKPAVNANNTAAKNPKFPLPKTQNTEPPKDDGEWDDESPKQKANNSTKANLKSPVVPATNKLTSQEPEGNVVEPKSAPNSVISKVKNNANSVVASSSPNSENDWDSDNKSKPSKSNNSAANTAASVTAKIPKSTEDSNLESNSSTERRESKATVPDKSIGRNSSVPNVTRPAVKDEPFANVKPNIAANSNNSSSSTMESSSKLSPELEQLKKEILAEIKKELTSMKEELIGMIFLK